MQRTDGTPLLTAQGLTMSYPGVKALGGVDFDLRSGEIHALCGENGAGKSTVLQIMAGLQQPSNGEAFLTPGYTVGILLQEPPLTEDKNVLENVQEGVAETIAMLNRFNEISAEMANPDADYDKLLPEMGNLQEQLDHRNAWDLDSQLEQAMDALRCPPADADGRRRTLRPAGRQDAQSRRRSGDQGHRPRTDPRHRAERRQRRGPARLLLLRSRRGGL